MPAIEAMFNAGIQTDVNGASLVVKPFVFVQHCYDEKFRLSLVFHVQSTGQAPQWTGRYTYHLPTSFSASEFGQLSPAQIAAYQAELADGASVLTGLIRRDLAGEIPSVGKRVNFGSLYLMGSKIGGLGIYTMPEQLYFKNAQIVEETPDYVTVRLKGNMHGTVAAGGLAFGLHRISKTLVHTMTPA